MPNDPTSADDPRMTWGLVIDLFDVLERHGYRKGDDKHTGAAVSYVLPLAELYSGARDELSGPGIAQSGGGWISGPSVSPPAVEEMREIFFPEDPEGDQS